MEYAFKPAQAGVIDLVESSLPRLATFRAEEKSQEQAALAWAYFTQLQFEAAVVILKKLGEYDEIRLYDVPSSDIYFVVAYKGETRHLIFDGVDEEITQAELALLRAAAQKRLVPWWRDGQHHLDIGLTLICVAIASSFPIWHWLASPVADSVAGLALLTLGGFCAWMSDRTWRRTARTVRQQLDLVPA